MKKNIVLGLTLVLLTLQQLKAQDSVKVSAPVAMRFEQSFAGAKNVFWTHLPKNVTQAQFHFNGASWVAYFDFSGNIITSGRHIRTSENLPLKVQAGLDRAKQKMEKKGSRAQVLNIYEMIQGDATTYMITLRNEVNLALYSIGSDGIPVLKLKKPVTQEPVLPKDAIARKQ